MEIGGWRGRIECFYEGALRLFLEIIDKNSR
jgi:hypothetical protein